MGKCTHTIFEFYTPLEQRGDGLREEERRGLVADGDRMLEGVDPAFEFEAPKVRAFTRPVAPLKAFLSC
eukprot:748141-Hanusia_phi.AAC.3